MDKNADTRNNKTNAQSYLKQTENDFSISPTTGLYQPKSSHPANEVNVHVDANLGNPRPRGIIQGAIANLLSSVALLISLFTLVGLGFTVKYAFKQAQEMTRAADSTADAANIAALALRENRKQFIETSKGTRQQLADFEKGEGAILRIRHEISPDQTKIKFFVKNVGHSAALNINIHSDSVLLPFRGASAMPVPDFLSGFLRPLPPATDDRFSLGEGEEQNPPIEVPIPEMSTMIDDIKKGSTRAMYLIVGYQDIFGKPTSIYDCLYSQYRRRKVVISDCPRN